MLVSYVNLYSSHAFVVVQLLSHVWLFVTPWTAAPQAPLSSTISWSLFKFMSIELVMLSNHLILCCSLLPLLQSFLASECFPVSWLFASGGQSIGSLAVALPMNIQDWFPSGLTWFDLLAIQGTLKNLLQHHDLKASILWCSAFFMIQLSHLCMTTGP